MKKIVLVLILLLSFYSITEANCDDVAKTFIQLVEKGYVNKVEEDRYYVYDEVWNYFPIEEKELLVRFLATHCKCKEGKLTCEIFSANRPTVKLATFGPLGMKLITKEK